ncbi:hypothetical protein F5B17DRAFT_317934 [Nemania serpens]|nr:hypothetical protein F5B17DRAFT_317934 [Nemania serpens]
MTLCIPQFIHIISGMLVSILPLFLIFLPKSLFSLSLYLPELLAISCVQLQTFPNNYLLSSSISIIFLFFPLFRILLPSLISLIPRLLFSLYHVIPLSCLRRSFLSFFLSYLFLFPKILHNLCVHTVYPLLLSVLLLHSFDLLFFYPLFLSLYLFHFYSILSHHPQTLINFLYPQILQILVRLLP